ncbi:hypothetical protein LOZ53_002547 [Ophidiomyces ophidiicola]|nr:hypothetical protein LOZ51_005536 [Ophidiomyces ophidiicola]KAI1992361.1 hypothetical protein LOZ53_002547 [Ophidiomyces ophidiicola]
MTQRNGPCLERPSASALLNFRRGQTLRRREFHPPSAPPPPMPPLRQLHWGLFSKASTGNLPRLKQSLRLSFSQQQSLHSAHQLPDFPILVSDTSAEHQIYQSLTTDPYINLSIENYLYKNTPNESKILFLYVNRPTVVIGRNQNPWLETNLHLLDRRGSLERDTIYSGPPITLLRRKSGGGTVFHDEGNLNFSVICPKPIFHRDKHAEMVVRALHKLGAANTSVNARHDIVMSQGTSYQPPAREVVKVSMNDAESPPVEKTPRAVKISGSAYKLSSFRALHHGTCLIESPNLNAIGSFLRSPARPYLRAKGVESVRSPIGNVCSSLGGRTGANLMQSLVAGIMEEFALMYNVEADALFSAQDLHNEPGFRSGSNWTVGAFTNNTVVGVEEIEENIREFQVRRLPHGVLHSRPGLKSEFQSLDWTYNQCPQFTFSTRPTEDDPRPRPVPPPHLHPSVRVSSENLPYKSYHNQASLTNAGLMLVFPQTHVFLRLKSGKIVESHISMSADPEAAQAQSYRVHEILRDRALHEISDWAPILTRVADAFDCAQDAFNLAGWLNSKLGRCSNF